jgi:hypothetical protein
MLSVRTQFAWFLLQACALCLPVSSLAQQPQEQTDSLLPAPPPLTLAQRPAGSIITLYQSGELTIEAQNANFRDVLRAVSRQTGAPIDVPPGFDERVFGIFGPGLTRDVLVSLLNGSHFNYVMEGSVADPG